MKGKNDTAKCESMGMTEDQKKNMELQNLKARMNYLEKEVIRSKVILNILSKNSGIKIEQYSDITVITNIKEDKK